MPKKRPHHKSRYGCDQCRTRRVKCDEILPCCSICESRGDKCHFSRQRSDPLDRSSTHESPPPMAISFLRPLPAVHSSSPVLETPKFSDIALMHHWCTRTCYSFTVHEVETFRDHVGREALRYDYLLDALLATTLLHIASETQDHTDVYFLVEDALLRQNKSMSGLRAALSQLSPDNCDAVFACSVLLMVCSIVSPLLSNQCGKSVRSTADAILLLADFIRGISSVVHLGRPWLEQGSLHRMFDSKCKHFFAATKKHLPAAQLSSLGEYHLNSTGSNHETFDHALQELKSAFNGEKSAVKWIVRVGEGFADALRKGDAGVSMLLMCWGVLLHGLDGTWWTLYSGRQLVEDLSASLDGREAEWKTLAHWCRSQVGFYN